MPRCPSPAQHLETQPVSAAVSLCEEESPYQSIQSISKHLGTDSASRSHFREVNSYSLLLCLGGPVLCGRVEAAKRQVSGSSVRPAPAWLCRADEQSSAQTPAREAPKP